LTGLGEASPMAGSFYSAQTPDSSWQILTQRIVPMLNGVEPLDLSGQWTCGLPDDPFAVNGIDVALWDLAAKRLSQPLWRLLGGDASRPIESGLAVGIYADTQTLCDRIAHHLQCGGYRRVKIKVQPGWDEQPLSAVRERWPDMPLMVDANCAYRREDIPRIAAWDRFGLMMIEQPLPREDLGGHAGLARLCRTPICLDEGAESIAAVERAIELGSASIINIKLQRLGTIAAALQVHEIAQQAGIGCWMGTMPELAVGGYAAIQFATLPNIHFPTDVEASERWFVADTTSPPIRCRDGLLILPQPPGLGIELDRDVIGRYKVREWSARLACRLS
jgi:O-succinylbenzoate synthase